jgi:hypothetical protein
MRARLREPAFSITNTRRAAQRRQTMRDREHRAAGDQPLERLLDGRSVSDDAARRFVENENARSCRIARAIEMRCRSPPDSVCPRSPTTVSYPCPSRQMKSASPPSPLHHGT